jgi:hypothetical protein
MSKVGRKVVVDDVSKKNKSLLLFPASLGGERIEDASFFFLPSDGHP